jgi:hypothetical protein
MEKTKEEKRVLPKSVMLRVQACGLIFQAEKSEKIQKIAEAKNVSLEEAGIAYTIGCLKHMRSTGTARNYAEALDILEARQVGDRGNMLNPPNALARSVERINRINRGDEHNPCYISSTDNGKTWTPVFVVDKSEDRSHTRSMGKVYGTLYTQWEAQEAESDTARMIDKAELDAIQAHTDKHLQLFFAEYVKHLSVTLNKRIAEIKADKHSSKYLASRRGREDVDTKSIARAAESLHRNFAHNDTISRREFIDLLRQYVQ